MNNHLGPLIQYPQQFFLLCFLFFFILQSYPIVSCINHIVSCVYIVLKLTNITSKSYICINEKKMLTIKVLMNKVTFLPVSNILNFTQREYVRKHELVSIIIRLHPSLFKLNPVFSVWIDLRLKCSRRWARVCGNENNVNKFYVIVYLREYLFNLYENNSLLLLHLL